MTESIGVGHAQTVYPMRSQVAADTGESSTSGKHAKQPPTDTSSAINNQINPYAPTGWKRKKRLEYDIELPSGQVCRIIRLEREDLFRLNLMQYLDTFTPTLMEDTLSEEERNRRMRQTISEKPDALLNMFMAVDQVVMACTVRPKITDDESKADYGTESDWRNPNFVATAYINDIDMEDRMLIFASTFGRSMDDLKSIWEQTSGVGGVADSAGIQQDA